MLLVLAGVLAALALAPFAWAADSDPNAEGYFTSAVNQARGSAGVPSLRVTQDLVDIARRHSAEMAANGRIYHNPNLESEVQNWRVVAENVGYGTSPEYVHKLFMDSDPHRRNILDSRVTDIGVGVVWSGDTLYVTEIFRQPMNSSQSTPPPPPPSNPPPAPAPAPPAPTRAPAPVRTPASAPPPAPAPAAAPVVAAPVEVVTPPTKALEVETTVVRHAHGAAITMQPIFSSWSKERPHLPLRRPPTHLVLIALLLQMAVTIFGTRVLRSSASFGLSRAA